MNNSSSIATRRNAIDDLDRAIVDLAARINSSTYELLVLIREFDERAGFLQWGLASCAEWLHWRCDLSLSAAREKVRAAHALKYLPQMSEVFARGTLSYSKVRALTRVATPQNEAALLAFAVPTTASRVEERCRQMRNVEPASTEESERLHRQRALRVFRDEDRGMLTLTVELPREQGELLCRALDKAVSDQPQDGAEFADTSWHAQQADALVMLARSYLAGESCARTSSAEAYQVVVHVDGTALCDGEGRADLPVESVRRLTCDGSLVHIAEGLDGEPLEVGRKLRTVPPAIRRALWSRDAGCAFPGCTHARFVDAHHVRHWAQGGETSLDNLLLLCTSHHRLVHEGGYEILKDYQGKWGFRRPDGRAIPAHGYRPEDMMDEGNPSAEGWSALIDAEVAGSEEHPRM